MKNPFRSKSKAQDSAAFSLLAAQAAERQRYSSWLSSPEGLAVLQKLEELLLPLLLKHNMRLTPNPFAVWTKGKSIRPWLEAIDEHADDRTIAAAVASTRACFRELGAEPTPESFLAQAQVIEEQIEARQAQKRQAQEDVTYYHEVRAGALRMELLEEAFRKNLDGEPIFATIATAATPELLKELRTVLAATPELTPEQSFDRALASASLSTEGA